jgi:hypothetical protein
MPKSFIYGRSSMSYHPKIVKKNMPKYAGRRRSYMETYISINHFPSKNQYMKIHMES